MNPLIHFAKLPGQSAQLKNLVDQHAVDDTDGLGNTALHWAAFHGRAGNVDTLLELGASVSVKNADGETPLMRAIGQGQADVANRLLPLDSAREKNDPLLHLAIQARMNSDFVQTLLKAGCSASREDDRHGRNALEWALSVGIPATSGGGGGGVPGDIVEAILQTGTVDLDHAISSTDGFNGCTALHLACMCGTPGSVVESLLSKGASTKAIDAMGRAAGHHAAAAESDEALNVLLQQAADSVAEWINLADLDGATPLHFAAKAGNESHAKLLMEKGGDRNVKNARGKEPRDICPKAGLRRLL